MQGLLTTIAIIINFYGYNARGIGLAGALTGSDAGPQTGYYNPAMLAYSKSQWTALSFLYIGAFAGNNAFTFGDINQYFQDGEVLNEYDKRHLLFRIGNGPLNFLSRDEVSLLAFKTPGFGIALEGFADVDANLHRQIFDLLLNGNNIGDIYHLTHLYNRALAYVSLDLAFGRGVYTMQLNPLRRFFFGIGLKAIRGLAYANLDRTNITLSIDSNYIYIDGYGRIISSMGGSGMGLDLGIGFEADNWSFGLSILNLFSKIRWNEADSATIFTIKSDSFTVYDIVNNPDTIITDSSWTEPVEVFYTDIPLVFRMGLASYFLNGNIRFFSDFVYRADKDNPETKLGLATELRFFPFLPLRFGIAFTSLGNFYTFGGGLRIFGVSLDLGFAFYRGIFLGSRGFRAGVDLGINLP